MNVKQSILGWALVIAGPCISVATAQDEGISLKPGIYVIAAERCKGAANASILSWDGVGFGGAHSSRCTSKIVSQSSARFQIKNTCLASGDGTAESPDAAYSDKFLLKQLSPTRFEVFKAHQPKRTYRWCGVGEPR